MTCRHSANDPDCSSNRSPVSRYSDLPSRAADPQTPDKSKYEIMDVFRVGTHLVLKVKYPNCANCAYEGCKVLVYLHVQEVIALKWREIDPHFRDPMLKVPPTSAPSPSARFPASVDGWRDAIDYATRRWEAMSAPKEAQSTGVPPTQWR